MLRVSERGTEILFGTGLILVVAGTILLGEATLRVRNHFRQQARSAEFDWVAFRKAVSIDVDEQPFARFQPGAAFRNVSINALGFRGPEVALPKPAATLRVVLLGNSVFLGAPLSLAETIGDRMAEELEAAAPSCAVDYIDVAGLGYTLDYLTTQLRDRAELRDANIFVAMGPTVREVLKHNDKLDPKAARPLVRLRSWFGRRSFLWEYAARHFADAQAQRFAAEHPTAKLFDDEAIRLVVRKLLADLAAATEGRKVVLLRANGDVREGMQEEKQKRSLLNSLIGMGVADVLKLRALIDEETTRSAMHHGWRYIDPLGALPADHEFFLDDLHPTSAGNLRIGHAIAHAIAESFAFDQWSCR